MIKKKVFLVLFFFILSLGFGINVSAEIPSPNEIYLESIASTIAPESEFSINVFLNAEDSINAFDIEMAYDKERLQFLSFDNTDSIVNIWQASPLISLDGNLVLSGGIIKSFRGEKGLLVKVFFRAIGAGDADVSFVKKDLYVADGRGTKVIAGGDSLSFSIVSVNENKDAKVIHEVSEPFSPTTEDLIIKKELENFKSKIAQEQVSIPFLVTTSIIFVICLLAVYNKFKRKT